MKSFNQTLAENKTELLRNITTTLQINVGLRCNLVCRHCHLSAGPERVENMSTETAKQVVATAENYSFKAIDITGGAPELNSNLSYLIESLAPLTPRLILRSNLVALNDASRMHLVDLCVLNKVVIVASFPALNEAQVVSQRGNNVFNESLAVLKMLNQVGYGKNGSELELDLVSNPTGAYIPSGQEQIDKRYHEVMRSKWGIEFNNLYTFANVPLGRFKSWLENSGNYNEYMEKLVAAFNPCAVDGVMCRSTISVSWDGYLYDCDFNQAEGLPLGGMKTHLTGLKELPGDGTPVAQSEHCYACTAGSGFT